MPTKRTLRILIIVELVALLLGVVVAFATEPSLPEPLRAYEQAQAESDFTTRDWILLIVGLPLLIALLASNIGLFFFRPFARPLNLLTTVVATMLLPLYGPYVASGWSQMFDEIGLILSGVVIAVVYWSPLKDLFEKSGPAADRSSGGSPSF